MAIPHKEYRFVFPAFACLALVAAMGSADLIAWLRRLMAPKASGALVALAVALWAGTSVVLAFTPGFGDEWFEARDLIEASFTLAGLPGLCGVLFYDDDWASTGGYAHLHRDVPIYALADDQDTAQESTAAFNAIVLSRESVDDFTPQFELRGCSGEDADDDTCVMVRPGTCTPVPKLEINAMLRRIGE
jgi:phosphatidylinositol glycan class B